MKTLAVLLAMGLAVWAQAPVQMDAVKSRIRELLIEKKYSDALAEAKSLNRQYPDDIVGYQLLVDAHLGLDQRKEAERAAQWMLDLKLGKADAQGWWRVAKVRAAYGEIEDALSAMATAISRARLDKDPDLEAMVAYATRLKTASRGSNIGQRVTSVESKP